MRIICPGCGSEYAIPDAAIPPAGREVQCAGCTHAWLQLPRPPARAPSDPAAADTEPPPPGAPDCEIAEPDDAAAAPPGPAEQRVDPQVLRILREEAAFEAAARRGNAPAPPPPGPAAAAGPAAGQAATATADRLESAGNSPPDTGSPPTGDAAGRARRDLPVVPSPGERTASVHRQRRRGFRVGFAATAGLACAAVAAYVGAPRLAEVWPAGSGIAEAVGRHGAQVQTALVELVRAAVDRPGTGG